MEWRGTIDTLENGVVLVRNPVEGIWDESSAWRLVEEVKIGTRDSEGPQMFGDVWDIDLDRLGRIYVLDRQAQDIRVFGGDGSYIRTIGRPGAGPGEFRLPTGMTFDPAGRLWVSNRNNLRYSVFDTSGALLKEPRRPGNSSTFLEWDGVFTREGDLYDRIGYESTSGRKHGYVRYDTTTSRFVDTIPASDFPEGTPFTWGRRLLTPDGRWLGVASEYRLYNTTFDGRDTVRIVERSYERIRLSRGDSAVQQAERLKKRLTRGSADISTPKYRKIFHGFVVDDEDYLWVMLSRDPDADSTTFDVFDPAGRYMGDVVVPHRVEPRPPPIIRGDKMAFATKDELDVEYVVRMRVER